MHVHLVMDHNGDTRHTFDPANARQLRRAEERFQILTGKGFRAVALGRDDEPGRLLNEFDPVIERTLFIPQLQGG